MRGSSARWAWGFAAALACASASQGARAEGPLALDRFNPAPAGDRMFGVPSPYVAGDLTPHVMVLADYAHNPLVISHAKGLTDPGAIVGDQAFLHLNASFAMMKRVAVTVDLPFAIIQSGDSPTQDGVTYPSPSGAQLGDLRLGARFRMFGEYWDPLQLAVAAAVWLPTGAKGDGTYVSDGKARMMAELIAGGTALDRLVWAFAFGPEIRNQQGFRNVTQGTMLRWGAGLGILLGDERRVQLGPEVTLAVTPDEIQKKTTNAELLLGARYRFARDFEAGLGAGPGLSAGIGSPDVRGVAMLAYTPEQPKPDRDADGVPDKLDRCPSTPAGMTPDPERTGCPAPPPPADRDHDGVPDYRDACPDVPGSASHDPAKNGCTADVDAASPPVPKASPQEENP